MTKKLNHTILQVVCSCSLIICLLACGGSGSGQAGSANIALRSEGVYDWQVDFAVLLDECGLLAEGVTNFEDQQTITVSTDYVSVFSETLAPEAYPGAFREDDSILASTSSEGDIFGDGDYCSLEESIAYNHLTDSSAEVLYSLRIKCTTESCESVLRGNAATLN